MMKFLLRHWYPLTIIACLVFILTSLIFFSKVWTQTFNKSVTSITQAAPPETPCDEPAQIYLLRAEDLLQQILKKGMTDGDLYRATTASAWMQLYQICSSYQQENLR